MTGTIQHNRQVTQEEAEASGYVIDYEEWNEGHVIGIGSARIYVGLDDAKLSVVNAQIGNVYMATDTTKLYVYIASNNWLEIITGIVSNPPNGAKKITNLYWDPATKEIVVIAED